MNLELIERTPKAGQPRQTPLLFIHGVFSCARIWEPFFLPFFAEHGYPAYALSLRGHGESEGRQRYPLWRLQHYVDDVLQTVARIGSPPVLIGTSMGGVLVQHYLRRYPTAAAVLMASGPPHGMLPSAWSMVLSNPILVRDMTMMTMLGPDAATEATARRALFRPDTPDEYIQRYLPRPQPESSMVMLDAMVLDLPPTLKPKVDVPVLVLGAERDAFITNEAVRLTGKTFGVEAEIFPGMPHAMMLDPEWEKVAQRMLDWLDEVLVDSS